MIPYDEPWRTDGQIVYDSCNICTCEAATDYRKGAPISLLSNRICLCVNALAGIPDAELAGLNVRGCIEYLTLVADQEYEPLAMWQQASIQFAKRALAILRGVKGTT